LGSVEIAAGLKNAVDHGIDLKKAAASYLNAGYPKKEVQEALNLLAAKPAVPVKAAVVQPQVAQQQAIQQPVKKKGFKLPKLKFPGLKSKKVILGGIAVVSFVMLILLIALIAALI